MSDDFFALRDLDNTDRSSQQKSNASQSHSLENWRTFFPEIIGRSPAMMKVLENVTKISRTESSVLILGESGTGKELIASAIHRLSNRADKRFMAINCSAIPEDLLESELFGYEQGAFTGANKRRAGFFEVAKGGTIFLDEIGEMPKRLQAKLLRVLQEKKYTPLGANHEKTADARIVAATNINLEDAVSKGEFRLDLFYRLNVFPVTLPPLRERGEDVGLLLEHFLNLANRLHNISHDCYFDLESLEILKNYSWPGNVRQLQNTVERLVVISGGGKITRNHLPREHLIGEIDSGNMESVKQTTLASESDGPLLDSINFSPTGGAVAYPTSRLDLPPDGIQLNTIIEEIENNYILEALRRTQNNKNRAAKMLGLNRTTLVERIKKRNILPLNAPSKEL